MILSGSVQVESEVRIQTKEMHTSRHIISSWNFTFHFGFENVDILISANPY